jgi:hypothetical protein
MPVLQQVIAHSAPQLALGGGKQILSLNCLLNVRFSADSYWLYIQPIHILRQQKTCKSVHNRVAPR